MHQTPVHDNHNPDLLAIIPRSARHLIEVGCSSGALAREYRKLMPSCSYLGVEIDTSYATLAKRYCDDCITMDIEAADEKFWNFVKDRDCWIFGDTLEHLRDPWSLLHKIRTTIKQDGYVVACIPNAQHWSLQVLLSTGQFRYRDQGLLDRTHLRWFTRVTIIELFTSTGFRVISLKPRIFKEEQAAKFLPFVRQLAIAAGTDGDVAVRDAMPLQYVICAVAD